MRYFRIVLILLAISLPFSDAIADEGKNFDLSAMEHIGVQSGGRIKPACSFAKEVVLFVTGKERFQGWDPIMLLLEWKTKRAVWEQRPLIPVGDIKLRASLGMSPTLTRIAPAALLSDMTFIARTEEIMAKQSNGEDITPIEKKTLEIYQKMSLFYNTSDGKTWTVIPIPGDSTKPWLSPGAEGAAANKELSELMENIFQSYSKGDAEDFRKAVGAFVLKQGYGNSFSLEILYQHLRPFHWAWLFYLLGAFVFGLGLTFKNRVFSVTGFSSIFTGFLLHTYGIVLRCLIAGRPPVSNMYESVIWVSWAAVFFSMVIIIFNRAYYFSLAAAMVASLGLILADHLPAVLDSSIQPLEPVLRSNYWLTIHVLTITLSYGAFALALGIAHGSLWIHAFRSKQEELIRKVTQFLYRALQIGVVLLAAGTILGGVWANYSWGRFWGWDPKETWALIALLGYLALLHSRYVGWVGSLGLALGSVVAFLGVLMAWYGVNFVLAAGLHSYGFGGGGLPYVIAFVLSDLLIAGVLTFLARRNILALRRFPAQ